MISTNSQKSFVADLIFYVPSKLIPAVVTFGLVIILTHALSTKEYGIYATVIAIIRLSEAISFSWMRQSILRFYSDNSTQQQKDSFQEKLLKTLVFVVVAEMFLVVLITSLFGYGFSVLLVSITIVLSLTPLNYLITIFQAGRLSKTYGYSTLIQSLTQAIWVFILVYFLSLGFEFALLGLSFGNLMAVLFIFSRNKRTNISLKIRNKSFDWKFIRKMWAYGMPMSLWLLSFQTLFFVNRLIIGLLRSEEEVGIFSSAYDLINGSISLIMTPFLLAVHPVIMQVWAESRNRVKIENIIKDVSRYIFIILAPLLLISIIFNTELFSILGEGYGVSSWVVPILVISAFTAQYSMYVHKGLEIAEQTNIMLKVGLCVAITNIIFNFIFVGFYGYEASAVISLFSYLIYMTVIYHFSKSYIQVKLPWNTIYKIVIALFTSLIIFTLVNDIFLKTFPESLSQLIFGSLTICLTYFLILIILNEFHRELNFLRQKVTG